MFCQTILKHYWPNSQCYSNIKEFDARPYRGKVDVLTGGFPCQPFSTAGKRRGTEDDRYLWPEMLRVIRQIQPRWIIGENVFGLINWNEGLVFEQVLLDLEAEGYEVAPLLLPAAGVNAPHQRYRIWIIGYNAQYATKGQEKADTDPGGIGRGSAGIGHVAPKRRNGRKRQHTDSLCTAELEEANPHSNGDGLDGQHCKNEKHPSETGKYAQCHVKPLDNNVANTNSKRLHLETKVRELARRRFKLDSSVNYWKDWPTQSPLCSGDDGLPSELDGIAFSKWREQSVKMYGNAIVPQVAVQIFSAIGQYESNAANGRNDLPP